MTYFTLRGLKLGVALAALAFLVGFAPSARAAAANDMLLCVSDTDYGCFGGAGNEVYVQWDGSLSSGTKGSGAFVVAPIVGAGDNSIAVYATLGIFNFNLDVGTYMMGNALDVTLTNATATGKGTLYVAWAADNYTTGNPFSVNGSATLGTGVASVTDTACYEGGNGSFYSCTAPANGEGLVPAGAVIGSKTITSTGALSFAGVGAPGGVPFGLEEDVAVNFSGPGEVSGDLSLVAVPEPSSILLFGGAFLLAAGAMRRKVQKS